MNFDSKFTEYIFKSEWDNDMVIAFLSQLPFDSFEEKTDEIIASLPKEKADKNFLDELNAICEKYRITYEKHEIKNKNWNQEWESNFKPVSIDNFCLIKANFHKDLDESAYEYVISITPQMTFGTGHHETTYTMIELMSETSIEDKIVFDFGAGTGILSILAEKMGARKVYAIDIDPIAVDNIMSNIKANNCNVIEAEFGDKAEVERYSYDLVLANINRTILELEAVNLSLALKKGGFLILSGILIEDKERIINLYERNSMKMMRSVDKGKWTALKFVAY